MVSAAPQFDPATLDIITPEHYEQNGYPHGEWAWLRRNDPVFWYERANVDPFWAITKHADIIAIGKQPELFLNAPRLAVFTNDLPPPPEGTCAPSAQHGPARPRALSAGHQRLVHAARDPRAWSAKVARITREVARRRRRRRREGDFVARRLGAASRSP